MQSMSLTLHDRLCLVVGRRSSRELAEMTGWSAESVRRYLAGQMPASDFIAELCRVTGTNAHWLVTGEGVRNMEEARAQAMSNAELAELVVSLCGRIEELNSRLSKLEQAAKPQRSDSAESPVVTTRRLR